MSFKQILSYIAAWKIFIFLVVSFSISTVKLRYDFLGGGLLNYLINPYIFSHANFDGEHYISIAREGYRDLTYFFFPLYPLLISGFSKFSEGDYLGYLYSGVVVSNITFILGLIGFKKIIELDFSNTISRLAILLLLFYPTSFYFGNVYTESLSFALLIWSFFLFRKEKYFFSGILGILSSLCRIVGVALIPAFIIEILIIYVKTRKVVFRSLFPMLSPLFGIGSYMTYLYYKTGNPLEFFSSITIFGEQRSTSLVLFPQVFYRYLFKVIPNIPFSYLPGIFTVLLEISTALFFILVIFFLFRKKMYSYAVFSLAVYTISTLSGSFSSFPRYSLMIFPVFILTANYLSKTDRIYKSALFLLMFVVYIFSLSLFSRGWWIS
jgi:Gpi18-like mannosyltransferase